MYSSVFKPFVTTYIYLFVTKPSNLHNFCVSVVHQTLVLNEFAFIGALRVYACTAGNKAVTLNNGCTAGGGSGGDQVAAPRFFMAASCRLTQLYGQRGDMEV